MEERNKGVFIRSAHFGLPMGLLLSVLSVVMVYTDKHPMLAMASLLLFALVPVTTLACQWRYRNEQQGLVDFSGLWLMGILMMIYGTIICSLVTYLLMTYARPGVIYDQTKVFLDAYANVPKAQNDPAMQQMLDVVRKAYDTKMLPSPIEYVSEMFWVTTFFGSMVSLVTAFIAKKLPLRK